MFSVVVPTYNKQELIGRTIASVLRQDFPQFELLIVDDGSTDATAQRVGAFDDPRIRLIQQENRGEGGARNAGMACARQPWIAFLDADDYWFADHLSELARIISRFPGAGMVSTAILAGDDWDAAPPAHRSRVLEEVDFFAAAGRDMGVITSSSAAIRADVAKDVGGFGSQRRGADQEYWARAALRTPMARSRRVTAYYYRHDGGVMTVDHHRKEVAPDRIEDMWPSVAVIRSVEGDPALRGRKAGFVDYERHATLLSMKSYILRGEIDVARRLSRRLPGTRLDEAAAIAAWLRLPDVAVSAPLHVRSLAKRWLHR